MGSGSETATARVGADGRFVFLNVAAGDYVVDLALGVSEFSVTANASYIVPRDLARLPNSKGLSATTVASDVPGLVLGRESGETPFWGQARVAVRDCDVSGITIPVIETSTIRGSVMLDAGDEASINATSALVAEPAAANALPVLQFAVLDERDRSAPRQTARAFEIRGLTPGDYYLQSSRSGALVKSISWRGQDQTGLPVSVTEAADLDDLVVTITTKGAEFVGTVRDRHGRPAPEATVICFPVDRQAWRRYGLTPSRIRAALSSTAGRYQLAPLPAGDYYLIAVAECPGQAWLDPTFFESAIGAATRVSIGWGETKQYDLRVQEVTVR